jgi:hypothetical protein
VAVRIIGRSPSLDVCWALRTARNCQTDWRRDEAERRHRPSRDVLVSIVKGLRAALFPAHFGISDFSDTSIDFYCVTTVNSS